MEFSGMMTKWSSRTKEHDNARVRKNQRRHRARTKAYIADLEKRLAETTAQLQEALARNAALAAELQRRAVIEQNREPPPADLAAGVFRLPASPTAPQTHLGQASPGPLLGATEEDGVESAAAALLGLSHLADPRALPPITPGESTILCSRAYEIMTEQNYDGKDLGAFSSFLEPGYRRATAEGGGCRVESGRIFAVIDAIRSSS